MAASWLRWTKSGRCPRPQRRACRDDHRGRLKIRPGFASASLVFGQIVHQALEHLFRSEGDPVQFFLSQWNLSHDFDLSYGQRDFLGETEKLRAIAVTQWFTAKGIRIGIC